MQDFLIRLILAFEYFTRKLISKSVFDFLFKSSQYVQKQLKIDYDEVYMSRFVHIVATVESLPVNHLLFRSGQKMVHLVCLLMLKCCLLTKQQ